jgi:hypothetical protein
MLATSSCECLLDETFTEPGNTHYSGPKEKVLDETFTKPDNKHSSDPKEKVLDETFSYFRIANNSGNYSDSLFQNHQMESLHNRDHPRTMELFPRVSF